MVFFSALRKNSYRNLRIFFQLGCFRKGIYRIAYLIFQQLRESATLNEREELGAWLLVALANRALWEVAGRGTDARGEGSKY